MCDLMVSRNVRINTAIAIIVSGTMCIVVMRVVLSSFPWVSISSVVSHYKSGILLLGIAFLPSLTFPIYSSSYS